LYGYHEHDANAVTFSAHDLVEPLRVEYACSTKQPPCASQMNVTGTGALTTVTCVVESTGKRWYSACRLMM
jgi:hypothetical protein